MEILRPRHYGLIEIGGATLSTSLIGRNTSLIIDPLFDTITKPLIELIKNNQFEEIPKWLRGLDIYDEFSSNMDDRIADFYRYLANLNFNNIYGLSIKAEEDNIGRLKGSSPLVICNFPHPVLMPPATIVESAKIITDKKGQLSLITENIYYIQLLLEYLEENFKNKADYNHSFIERNPQQVPISLYDMILGMPNYYYAEVFFAK
jgi:hypothetical protein